MHRRMFVRLLAAAASAKAAGVGLEAAQQGQTGPAGALPIRTGLPPLKVVSAYAPVASRGMPGAYPGRVVSVKSDRSVDTATGQANDAVVREMMARGMMALTGAATARDAWRGFFEPSDVVGIKVNCGGYPVLRLRVRDRGRDRAAADGRRRAGVADLLYERFQSQLDEVNYAPHLPEGLQIAAAERANRYTDNGGYDPATYLEAEPVRRRGHPLEHDAAGVAAADQDRQHPEHEGPRRHRRDRLPEEHRLRQLLERRAHPPARRVPHLLGGRHAGLDRAAALADGAADHGRPARRVARRPVRADDEVRLLPAPDHVRHRSCRHRSPAARHHRERAASSRARSRSGTAPPPRSRWTTPARATPTPTSTSSSASPGTSSSRHRSGSASTTWPRSRYRTSAYDAAPASLLLAAAPCCTGRRASRAAAVLEAAGIRDDLRPARPGRCLEGGRLHASPR